ncbi:MAG: hypothetical protein ACI9SC_000023 [Gammaproteobacteria bacterium]|jgi:hypothetical protein
MQQKQLIRSQVEILYSQSAVTFLFPVFVSIILAFVLWKIANRPVLLGWVTSVCIYAVARFVLLWKYTNTEITPDNASKWHDAFIATACLSGIMWGLAAIILIPHDGKNIVEFTLYTGITLLSVSGLVAGATISYAVSLKVLFFYILPALLPPALYLISLGDIYSSTLGGFILLYCFFISSAGYRMNGQLLGYIQKQSELEKLKWHYQKLKLMYEKISTRDIP